MENVYNLKSAVVTNVVLRNLNTQNFCALAVAEFILSESAPADESKDQLERLVRWQSTIFDKQLFE